MPRRVLLSRALTLLAAVVPTGAALPRALAEASTRAALTLAERGGDVWAWRVRVHGRVDPPGPVTITADGAPIVVHQHGSQFRADVALGSDTTRVRASTKGGHDVASYARPLRARPRAVATAMTDADLLLLDATASTPSPETGAPLQTYAWRQRMGTDLTGLPASGATVRLAVPPGRGPWYLDLRITDQDGEQDVAGLCLVRDGGGVRMLADDERAPWIAAAVIYGVIPFAFGTRGFADVEAALDRLVGLGVSCLWLSPTFATERFEFGYGVTDYFTTRSDYGGEEALRSLIDAAHRRKLRVLLDLAVNHTSDQHRYFRHAQQAGTQSHQWAYYQRDKHGHPVHYFDWKHLPNLDYDQPEVRRWITEVATYWVRELDVDGYRFDAAWGVRQRRPDFWPSLVTEMRRVRPDALLLAEASSRDRYYAAAGFELTYDWTDELGQWAWRDVFGDPAQTVARLDAAVTAAHGPRVLHFLNNNDTGERFLDRYGMGTTRVATALLLTLSGVPTLYCGDEVGASLDPYEVYAPIDWTTHPELRAWHVQLLALRRELPDLRAASWRRVAATPAADIYAYVRGKDTIVVLNFASEPRLADVERGPGTYVDRLTGDAVLPGAIAMPAFGARVLARARREVDS